MEFKLWIESSLNDLYQSVVEAFPNTKKRQYSIDEIKITNLQWIPFEGVKTLFVKGLAQNITNGHEYNPIIVFKGMKFHRQRDIYGLVEITDNMGVNYLFEKLNYNDTQILVRCGCADFRWRMNFADHLSNDLFGRKRKKYEALYNPGSANPNNDKGLCKHLMKMMVVLGHSGIID